MYSLLKKLEDGEFVRVASRDDLQEAVQSRSLSTSTGPVTMRFGIPTPR